MALNNGIVEAVSASRLSSSDVTAIFEIEQDAWSNGQNSLGEYVYCSSCETIYSKQDIYGESDKNLLSHTVAEIERILGIGEISCPCCYEQTNHIYDREKYMPEIVSRYRDTEAFLAVFRDEGGVLRGFFDGYMADFPTIFKREFQSYYAGVGLFKLKRIIEDVLGRDLPKDILLCSALGMEPKFANFSILYELLRAFFEDVYTKKGANVLGMAEAEIGTNTHGIYHAVGATGCGVHRNDEVQGVLQNKKDGHASDILIQPSIPQAYMDALSVPVRNFLRDRGRKMRSVLQVA